MRERSPRRAFAEEMARLRAESGLSLRDLGEKVRWDFTHLHNMERGHTLGGPDVVASLDTFYGTTPHLTLLWELAKGWRAFRDRYQRYMELESEAVIMQQYSVSIVPGLLQTEAYARELLSAAQHRDKEGVEDQVIARVGRKERLFGLGRAEFRAILSEAVVRAPLADPEAWREQLDHLITMAQEPNIAVQVFPFSRGLHGLSTSDVMFLTSPSGTTMAYVETGYSGELVESHAEVERLRVLYDRLRDLAWSPRETVAFLRKLMEDPACVPPQ
ncbi:helix-turn-helix domain-containing protein [Streptomyces boetiae]|uniref:helix-turn-helix domain-containing protein n=1 Tax=Streptomyces boetiae TaxID=3075541 RepID=UPI00288ACC1F|nr:helix-turn-helix transcriptional regulator [Streptomyces sp. DSM 44917]